MPKHPFDYHRPNETQVKQIETVRNGCKALHAILLDLPPSRERSLAITKLEEVSMWANKGIIMVDEGPVDAGAVHASLTVDVTSRILPGPIPRD